MKAGPDLEQAGDAAAQHDAALGRLGDAAQDLEQRALAGAIAADDADDLALLDLEADVLAAPRTPRPRRPERPVARGTASTALRAKLRASDR